MRVSPEVQPTILLALVVREQEEEIRRSRLATRRRQAGFNGQSELATWPLLIGSLSLSLFFFKDSEILKLPLIK